MSDSERKLELSRRRLLELTGGAGAAGLAGCGGGTGGGESPTATATETATPAAGGGGTGTATPTPESDSGKPFGVWTWTQDFFEKPEDWFEESHSGIDVQIQRFPFDTYVSKVVSGLAAGQSPDVLTSSVLWVPKFGYRDTVLRLEENGFDPSDFVSAARANSSFREGTSDGHLYAVPGYIDCRMVAINEKKFKQAGLEIPSRTKVPTWDQFRMWAEELNKEFKYGFSFQGGEGFDNFLLANGGSWLNEDSSKAVVNNKAGVRTAEWLKGMIDDDLVRLRLPGSDVQTIQDFQSGAAPMAAYIGSWDLSRINKSLGKGTWRYVPMPKGPMAEKSHSWSAGVFQMAPKKGQTDLALDWLNFLASERMQIHLMNFGGFPGKKSVYQSDAFSKFLSNNPNAATIKQEIKKTKAFPDHTKAGEMYSMVHREIQKVYEGKGEPQEVLDGIAKKLEDLLRQGYPKP